MSHRNKCVVILFSVLIVFFFYAYFNNRYYEKSATIYQIDFLQQLSGIENLSSLTFHREQKLLYATQNRPATLLKLNLKGELLHSVPVPFLSDAETIEHICGNIFAAIDESTSELFFFSVSDDMTITLRNSIPLQKFNKKNQGFEGIAWNSGEKFLYAAKERKPHIVFTWQLSQNLFSATPVQLSKFPYQVDVDDISALDYSDGKLLVLSDESGVLLETEHTGKTYIEVLRLKQGNHGLTEDIPQPEGVVRTPDGSIYIASEPNLIARFRPVQ